MRYGAIDTGSNAVRLLIAEVTTDKGKTSFKKNTLIRVPLRLGDDAFMQQQISDKKADDLVKTMHAFKNLMDVYKVSDYMACATSAMREARNGQDIVERIKREASLNLEIVHGEREANIIYASHANLELDKDKNYLYIDVGGGSTELTLFSEGTMIASKSFNIGTIRILDNQDKDETWQEMSDFVKLHTRNYKTVWGVGTGGNINKLYKMSDEKDGSPLSYSKLRSLYDYLDSYTLKDRINVLKLNQDRADVIIPACQIYTRVMKWANIKSIYVPSVGMADGIIQMLIEKNIAK